MQVWLWVGVSDVHGVLMGRSSMLGKYVRLFHQCMSPFLFITVEALNSKLSASTS